MDFGSLIRSTFNDPTFLSAVYGLCILAVVDLLTGVSRAFSDSTFTWALLDSWVRLKLAGRLIPILILLIAGQAAPDLTAIGLTINVLGATALIAAATFAASELASIVANVNPATPTAAKPKV
jgi:hypothetical protein